MEGLILLFGEFVSIAFTTLLSLFGLLLQILLHIIGFILKMFGIKWERNSATEKKWKKKVGKVILKFTLATMAIVGGVALVVNFFFFQPTANWLFDRLLKNRGIEYSVKELDGNFFTGNLRLEALRMKGANWEIEADKCNIDLGISSLLFRTKSFDRVEVAGFRGKAKIEKNDNTKPARRTNTSTKRIRLPRLKIHDLSVSDASMELQYSDGGKPPISSIVVRSLSSDCFSTRSPLFHLFFRSNLDGELNGSQLTVNVADVQPKGKPTSWKADEIPINLFSGSRTILGIVKEGTMDLDVSDYWKKTDRLEVDMDWKVTLSDAKADPNQTNVVRKSVANYINNTESPIVIGFSLVMNPNELEGSSSEASAAIYQSVSRALVKEVARKTGVSIDSAEESRKKLIDSIRKKVDKARK